MNQAGSGPERRSRKTRRTRDTLAQAAFELVLDRGLRNVTVEEIAQAADVDRRTFSRHFPNKEAAALDAVRGDGDRINQALRARPAAEPPLVAYRGAVLDWLDDPGAMAEYMIVDDACHLTPIGDLDPVKTVSLTDAGLTPYHAIKRSLPKLLPGATAVVIGTGGLGHVAIQLLRAMTAVRVIALDVTEEKLALARTVGAHETVLSDENAAQKVRELTGGVGAKVVFDFVGAAPTVKTAGAVASIDSDVTIVGIGGGMLPVGFGVLPFSTSVTAPYWGSRKELAEVIELAHAGAVDVHVETYSIDEAPLAYERLHAGRINGRAVILPNG